MARTIEASGSKRRLGAACTLAALVVAVIGSPAPAATPDEAAAGLTEGVYIEPGAESVDVDRLAAAREDAADAGLGLSVVVLAESVDAVGFADSVMQIVSGTVLVFTPTDYGVASDELTQSELDDALDEAAARLAGSGIAEGVASFVDAAIPTRINWGAIFAVGLLTLVVVAVVGRVIERRATAARRTAALARRWGELVTRADILASPVLDLSTRVELDGRPDLAERYRDVASRYGELRDALDRRPTPSAVDEIDDGLEDLGQQIDEIERALGRDDPGT